MKQFFFLLFLLLAPVYAFAGGSQTYATPGTYSFTVPTYGTLTVIVNGAGGGGGSGAYFHGTGNAGTNGFLSSFNGSVVGSGGGGGGAGTLSGPGANGFPGSGAGGDTNTDGGGSAGGAGSIPFPGFGGGDGGYGGQAVKTYSTGQFTPGSAVTVVVGTGGVGGNPAPNPNGTAGSPGTSGSVSISWATPVPTCTITFDQNPIPFGGSTTLHYSSADASTFYINNIGYVLASGATTVSPGVTTDYSGTVSGPGGSTTCPAVLSVTPPAPTITISANPSTITVGQSSTITATFAAGTGDTLTDDTINIGSTSVIPYSTASTRSYIFTPSSAGSTTFLPYIMTSAYPSWNTWNHSVVVTTTNPVPACTVSLSPNSIAQGGSSFLSYSSSNATSFTIVNVGPETPNTSNSLQVTPSQTTDYTGTASAGGVNATCPATLDVTCTPTYSCSGQTLQHTDSSCNVTNVTTCVAPQFCSPGSPVCLTPQPVGSPNGTLTGHLTVKPNLVSKNATSTVYWDIANVTGCTVTANDGTAWTGNTSATSSCTTHYSTGCTSRPIIQQTMYTLSCTELDASNYKETATVNVLPNFQER